MQVCSKNVLRTFYGFSKFPRRFQRSVKLLLLIAFFFTTLWTIFDQNLLLKTTKNESQILFNYYNDYESISNLKEINKNEHAHLPNCLIIGVRKGGTRALLDALALHPDIRVARHEVHFFDMLNNFQLGTEWYLQQMPLSLNNQIVIEKTPAYFVNKKVPKRVFEFNPHMKLILIVRDPVIRLISDFTQVHYTRFEKNKTLVPFYKAVFFESTHQLNRLYKPVRNSLYAKHLHNWLQYFKINQILVIDGDNFIKNPLGELRIVERFLGLPHKIQNTHLVFNHRKGFYCFRRKSQQIAHCLGATKGRTQIPVDEITRRILARQFHSDNKQFFQQIGQNFTNWYS